ncbi:MAG TPA: hypothetical protein VHQ65_10855 [Thermoanaerobaculia bacterium]|nr:hypothetical protein [Thermoanaerobaculia bacterium]
MSRLGGRAAGLVVAASLLLLAAPAAGQALPGGPLPAPLLPADNWWNLDVSRAPVDPASDALLDFVGRDRRFHPDFGGDAPDFPEIYGIPYVSVPGDQPLVPVTFVEFGDESDAGAPGRPPGYPIPPEARDQPGWIEGGHPGAAEVDGDRHLLLVDRDHRILYELYHARWNQAAGRWEAGSGAVWPLDRNHRRPEGWTSADAAGLAILPGLVRYDEVFGPGPIRHAFRFTVPRTDGFVWPASHRAGNTPGAPPLGTRLRLKAGVDLSPFPPEVRKIFQAMKTYGLILADNGSAGFVQGTYDRRWNNDVLNPAFRSLTMDDFEVIELGWRPASGPGPGPDDPGEPGEPCVPGDAALCLGAGARFRVEAAWSAPGAGSGTGHAVPRTADTGTFWFFDAANLELVVKVLDGCGVDGHHWVFAAGLTNVAVEITVTDTTTGAERRYTNPQRTPFQPVQDTRAFACS